MALTPFRTSSGFLTPGTPGQYAFDRDLERFTRSAVRGYGMLRPEWSKGWAFSGRAIWDHEPTLRRAIPPAFGAGRRRDEDFDWARRRLNRYDPHRVFSNSFLDRFVPG